MGAWLKKRLRTISAFVIGFAAVSGFLLVLVWGTSDASREIGGALISGAIVGAAILLFEEAAEQRRQKIADEREDRFELAADERQRLLDSRADERMAREDRLAIWRDIDAVVIEKLLPSERFFVRVNQHLGVKYEFDVLNDQVIKPLRVALQRSITPLLDRLPPGSEPTSIADLRRMLTMSPSDAWADEEAFETYRVRLQELVEQSSMEVAHARVAERDGEGPDYGPQRT